MLQPVENLVGDHGALLQTGTAFCSRTDQGRAQALEGRALNDVELCVEVLADLVELHLLDGQRAGVTLNAVTDEDLYVDDSTLGAGRHAQRGVLNVAGLFTEDSTQQFFFRGQLGFALRRDLAYQNIARANFGTYVDDARLVQLVQRSLAHVGDIRGDFFWAELGITGYAGQFLNVDSGETIFLNHTLREKDGVFEVVAVPGHERDAHVLAQSQFTHIGGRTIGHDVATLNHITLAHQRTLVDAGVLVGTGVLGQVVDVDTGFASFDFIIMNAHNDTAGINRVDNPATTGNHTDTGVARYVALHPGTHQRLVRTQGRHGLTLHVRAHQRAVGVVVFEERNQRSSNRNNLLGRYVHQGDVFRRLDGELVQVAYGNQLVDQFAAVQLGAGLGNYVVGLFDGGEEYDLVGDFAILDHAVRAFQETVLVGAGVGGQRVDQADVRTFRRFDRAHAAVMGRVYVTDFEACTL